MVQGCRMEQWNYGDNYGEGVTGNMMESAADIWRRQILGKVRFNSFTGIVYFFDISGILAGVWMWKHDNKSGTCWVYSVYRKRSSITKFPMRTCSSSRSDPFLSPSGTSVPPGEMHFWFCQTPQSIRSCTHRSQTGSRAHQPVPCLLLGPPTEQPQSALQRLTNNGMHVKEGYIVIGYMMYMG